MYGGADSWLVCILVNLEPKSIVCCVCLLCLLAEVVLWCVYLGLVHFLIMVVVWLLGGIPLGCGCWWDWGCHL